MLSLNIQRTNNSPYHGEKGCETASRYNSDSRVFCRQPKTPTLGHNFTLYTHIYYMTLKQSWNLHFQKSRKLLAPREGIFPVGKPLRRSPRSSPAPPHGACGALHGPPEAERRVAPRLSPPENSKWPHWVLSYAHLLISSWKVRVNF